MAITQLTIEGFRSLKRVEWKPAPLNVLIGPNGSGKSNLLRALRLLRSAAEGKLRDAVLSAGGMGALTWDSSTPGIAWSVALDETTRYDLALYRLGASAEHVIDYERLNGASIVRNRHTHPASADKIRLAVETALSTRSEDDDIASVRERLLTIAVYHDLNVHEDAPLRQAAIARRETALAPDGQNLIAVLHTLYSTDREFKETLNDALRAAFGREFEELVFPPVADQRVDMRIRWRSLRTEQSTANLSDGTLRFLMLATILAAPSNSEIIAIDEPELGLHPTMLPIITELAEHASERTQIIFTTHSPQFLDAFEEPPTTTVVTLENGESKFETLSGKDLEEWLKRYTLGELFRSGQLEAMA